MQDNLEILSKFVAEDKAKEILKLTESYDSYIAEFKKQLDSLLLPLGYEVKTGIVFKQLGEDDGSD